jgi:hypothetical protein
VFTWLWNFVKFAKVQHFNHNWLRPLSSFHYHTSPSVVWRSGRWRLPFILFSQVKQALDECNMLVNIIRGQSHDIAAVMKGEVRWLQVHFKNITNNKYTKYVPSAPHSLNLWEKKLPPQCLKLLTTLVR